MVWLAISAVPGAQFGYNGNLNWLRPETSSPDGVRQIPKPLGLTVVNQQSSWALYRDTAVNCGGFVQNAIVTRHWQLEVLGIRAPNVVPDVSLAAGPGFTANAICYLRFYDLRTDERSPLSAPSATLAASNQKVTYAALNTIAAPSRATHIEGWESRDGGLPRFVWRRQIGVTTVTHGKPLGDLGEAETSDWQRPPRCRYVASWHERIVMGGDDDNPDTVYILEIGFPERWAGLTLRTKSGQPVVGLAEINGVLLVGCPTVIERISGWTEDDLKIEILQPSIGLVSHWSFIHTHGWLWFTTQEQPFVTDGVSFFPMGLDIKPKWASEYKLRRRDYEAMWGEHLKDQHMVRWYVRQHSDVVGRFVYWAADYTAVFPQEGGGMGQPAWTYDTFVLEKRCGALMAVPRGRRQDALTGGKGGVIWREDVASRSNDGGPNAAQNDKRLVAVTGAQHYGQIGGDETHAIELDRVDMLVRAESNGWDYEIYAGDVECYDPLVEDNDPNTVNNPAFAQTVTATAEGGKQPVWVHSFGDLPSVAGFNFVHRIFAAFPLRMRFAGLVVYWKKPGTAGRQPGVTVQDPG